MTVGFTIELLDPKYGRTKFACGEEALDNYLRKQAGQDVRRRVAACYLAVESGTSRVAGFYALAAGGIPLAEMPEYLAKRTRCTAGPIGSHLEF